ncbi:MAG: SCO family protein [Burkholderiales bacterium]|nr:SCO family protein [Burkholderiales bacterium]
MDAAELPWTQAHFCAEVASAASGTSRTRHLVLLLQEEHPAYAQCSSAEVSRRRGWVLVELGNMPLESEAVPLVLEELETGLVPYLLAAAARALRQAETPLPGFAPVVLRALETLARRDDLVDLGVWGGMAQDDSARPALDEVFQTLRWLGPHMRWIRTGLIVLDQGPTALATEHRLALQDVLRGLPDGSAGEGASCCDLPLPWRRHVPVVSGAHVDMVRFEDQDGAPLSWRECFVGQPTVVAFFYTRCDNEQKCSLTITKVAQLQRLLQAAGLEQTVHIAAITYDPDFDLPPRLRGYASSRGLIPGLQCRLLRATQGREALQRFFASGVNFVGSLVNRHRIEVFVLDAEGRIAASYQRLGWDPKQVVLDLRALPRPEADPRVNPAGTVVRSTPVLWAFLLALLPKCPICGAAYLSVTGLAALPHLPGWLSAWPAFALLLLTNLAAIGWADRRKRRWASLVWSVFGTALIVGAGLALGQDSAIWLGIACMAIGSAVAVLRASPRKASTRQV